MSRKTTQTETHVTQLRPLYLFGNLNIAVECAKIALKLRGHVQFVPIYGSVDPLPKKRTLIGFIQTIMPMIAIVVGDF